MNEIITEVNVDKIFINGDIDCFVTISDSLTTSIITYNIEPYEINHNYNKDDNKLTFNYINKTDDIDKHKYIVINASHLKMLDILDGAVYFSNLDKKEFFSILDIENIRISGKGLIKAKNIINENKKLFISLEGQSLLKLDEIITPYKKTQITLNHSSNIELNEKKDSFINECSFHDLRYSKNDLYLTNVYFESLYLNAQKTSELSLNVNYDFNFVGDQNSLIHLNLYSDTIIINKKTCDTSDLNKYLQGECSDKDKFFKNIAQFNFSKKDNQNNLKNISTYLSKVKINENYILSNLINIQEINIDGKIILNSMTNEENIITSNEINVDSKCNFEFKDNKLTIRNNTDEYVNLELKSQLKNLRKIEASEQAFFYTNETEFYNLKNIKIKNNATLKFKELGFEKTNIDINSAKLYIEEINGDNLTLKNHNGLFEVKNSGFISNLNFSGFNKQKTLLSSCLIHYSDVYLDEGLLLIFLEHIRVTNKNGKIFIYQMRFNKSKNKKNIKNNNIFKESPNLEQEKLYKQIYEPKMFLLKILNEQFPTEKINDINREKLIKGLLLMNEKDISSLNIKNKEKYNSLLNIYTQKKNFIKHSVRF